MKAPRRSPDEIKAGTAARTAKWRERKAVQRQQDNYADHILGIAPHPEALPPPKATDVAKILRDRYLQVIETLDNGDLLNKDFAPALGVALKAQDALDRRESKAAKQGNAELAFAIIGMLTGQTPLRLDDGNTIDGEAVDVDG